MRNAVEPDGIEADNYLRGGLKEQSTTSNGGFRKRGVRKVRFVHEGYLVNALARRRIPG